MNETHILHLVPTLEFEAQDKLEPYRPTRLEADGFIHCTSTIEVLLEVANRFYRQVPGEFLVLVIDPSRVEAEVKLEPPAHPDGAAARPGETLFPHIYGALNRDAIVEIRRAQRAGDGRFVAV